MRIPFFNMFMTSPFEGLQEHAEKVKECSLVFQQAIECHFSPKCSTFEEFRDEIARLESEADAIKRRIRGHIPKRTMTICCGSSDDNSAIVNSISNCVPP